VLVETWLLALITIFNIALQVQLIVYKLTVDVQQAVLYSVSGNAYQQY